VYDIQMSDVSDEFAKCWQAAASYLEHQAQGPLDSWLRAELNPPFLEHLSFRLGNQLFFIRLEDVEGNLDFPGNPSGLLSVADGCKGHPCLMPMRNRFGQWSPASPGWGLVHARTGVRVDPPALITNELIEMSDWELHDFAVQTVREQIEKEGREIMSWQGNPSVDPSIWFVGDQGPEWVVVRAVRYPEMDAIPPANWPSITRSCARLSKTGNFASVSVANADDPFDPSGAGAVPLWRGHGMVVRYMGPTPGPFPGRSN
jgi:hypothetical protein